MRLFLILATLHQLGKYLLRPIQNTCRVIIMSEFKKRLISLLTGQVGTVDQPFVDQSRPPNLTALAIKITESQVNFNGFAVNVESAKKQLQSLVVLLVEKIVDSCR